MHAGIDALIAVLHLRSRSAMANTYHIHPRYDGTWLAIKEGALSVSVRASTLAEAVERTCEAAQRWNADVLLHRADGSVEKLCEGQRSGHRRIGK